VRREIDYRFTSIAHVERVLLDAATLQPRAHNTLVRRGFPVDARVEDCRSLRFRGQTLCVHTLVHGGVIRPVLSRVTDREIVYTGPISLPTETTRIEKNWVLFDHGGELHCLYRLDPLTIFARGRNGTWRLVKRVDNGWSASFAGMLSNSANLVPFAGGHLGFWHSIVDGRYVQGAMLLDENLDIACATGALLDGHDAVRGYKPGVLYVSALVVHAGRVLAFYGEGDAHSGVATFDAAELEAELRRRPFVPASRSPSGWNRPRWASSTARWSSSTSARAATRFRCGCTCPTVACTRSCSGSACAGSTCATFRAGGASTTRSEVRPRALRRRRPGARRRARSRAARGPRRNGKQVRDGEERDREDGDRGPAADRVDEARPGVEREERQVRDVHREAEVAEVHGRAGREHGDHRAAPVREHEDRDGAQRRETDLAEPVGNRGAEPRREVEHAMHRRHREAGRDEDAGLERARRRARRRQRSAYPRQDARERHAERELGEPRERKRAVEHVPVPRRDRIAAVERAEDGGDQGTGDAHRDGQGERASAARRACGRAAMGSRGRRTRRPKASTTAG
jgi:hypothetical protein